MKRAQLSLCASIVAALATLPAIAAAQSTVDDATLAGLNTAEAPRVTQTVNSANVAPIQGTHLALVGALTSQGAVSDATPMNHMQLVLRPSDQRKAALEWLIAAQHDPLSPLFHHWITPKQFGKYFGAIDSDVAATESWLKANGFTVNGVYANNTQIDFSGTAGQVNKAFHTQMTRYTDFSQESHIANASDISVPVALQSVVVGAAGVNDFKPHALHVPNKVAQFDPATQRFKVQAQGTAQSTAAASKKALSTKSAATPDAITFTNGARGLVPYDLAKMYGVDTLRAKGITGKNVTIAVVEDSSMVPADWSNFVSQFSLGSYGGSFSQIQPQATGFTNCIDPTIANPGEDDGETLLDAEWSTAMAPGAHIVVASCDDSNSNNFFGGVITAATNLVNGDSRPNVISASYGYGENNVDAASKTAIDLLWAQADVEGISVFVSTGDSGSNPSYNAGAIYNLPINGAGISANALATSPNVTAVGGTDTADVLDGTTSQYFSSKLNSTYGSALSYVPEIPWNESCANPVAAKANGYKSALDFCQASLAADPNGLTLTSESGSGGPSSVDRKPFWQQLVYGAANDKSRDIPDVSLFAGSYGGDTWVIVCDATYPCNPGFTGSISISGGTSLASPMFAGIQALVDQGLSRQGRVENQGNAAPTLYALATLEYGGSFGYQPLSLDQCNSDRGAKGTSQCVFHNVTRGGISTQCIQQLPDTVTPDCYFYATIPNYELDYLGNLIPAGSVQLGLTSTSTSKYVPAFSAQRGWSFAAGLGSVNATNLLSAWKSFNRFWW